MVLCVHSKVIGRGLKHLAEQVDAYHEDMAAAAQQGSTRTAATMQVHAHDVCTTNIEESTNRQLC